MSWISPKMLIKSVKWVRWSGNLWWKGFMGQRSFISMGWNSEWLMEDDRDDNKIMNCHVWMSDKRKKIKKIIAYNTRQLPRRSKNTFIKSLVTVKSSILFHTVRLAFLYIYNWLTEGLPLQMQSYQFFFKNSIGRTIKRSFCMGDWTF